MARHIAKFLLAALLLGLFNLASAAALPIDIFNVAGVSGTGGDTTIVGPCYCEQPAHVSPVFLLQPGVYDFGMVRDYWVQSGFTPDGGPDQAFLYLLFDPVVTLGTYPDDFGGGPAYTFPSTALCGQDDAGCNATYRSAYTDFDLIYTLSPGQGAAQIELIGNYRYTAPVPEPLASGMLACGLALILGISTKRGRAGLRTFAWRLPVQRDDVGPKRNAIIWVPNPLPTNTARRLDVS